MDYDYRCMICGSPISNNKGDMLGAECREVYRQARIKVFFSNRDRKNDYYNVDSEYLLNELKKYYSDTKFHKPFKKEFYETVINFFDTNGFLTFKQKQIIENTFLRWKWYDSDYDKWLDMKDIKQANMIEDWIPTPEEYIFIRDLANKLRHELRNKRRAGN